MNFSIRMLGKQVAICGLLAGTLIACVTPAHDPRITGAPETHPAASALTLAMYAGADKPCVQPLGNLRSLQGWKGLEAKEHGAELRVPGKAFFAYPNRTKGWYNKGFREENDGTADWRDFYGIQLEVNLEGDKQAELVARIKLPDQPARVDYVPETATTITLCGKGWQTVTLPWSSFDFQQAQPAFLKFVQTLELSVRSQGATKADSLLIRSVRLVKGETVSLESMVRGKSAKPGESVEYIATVGNCTKKTQSVNLAIEKHGWEVMPVSVEPAQMLLAPGETKECKVRVTVADRVPAGGTETQKLRVVANGKGDAAATLSFVTASAVPHPNILHTAEEWQEVRDKVQKYEWARKAQDEYIKTANKWKVPEIADPAKIVNTDDTMGPYLFRTQEETGIVASAVSWQLTRNTEHAKKVALFLLRLSDPTKGYPTTFRGCHQSFVQEGHWMQHMAMCYDMILDANVLTEAERAQIEQTFRVYIESVRLSINMGAINNWNVSEFCGALYCSLAMQDMALVDRHLNGPTGILDQMRHGIMNDGWWYECSISYNIWVAREFSQVAIAMRPWGMDLAHAQIPNGYSRNYGLVPWSMQPGLYGMSFEKFGPVTSSYVTLKRMWDALPVFGDYRGIIFGINDTTEKPLGGDAKTNSEAGYEVAYYLFRDPVYANIIKQSGKRDLLYGVPELPKKTPDTSAQSAHADNVGVALLRSQATEARERIQAVLHYGSHGGFHG
ncbi:TPA: hypothetical protein DDW35_10020, partial [Candidatus Sumerlaeota bacterium]|nr:hypothetical protein [Candidatus Sumerlaeota bacterium]